MPTAESKQLLRYRISDLILDPGQRRLSRRGRQIELGRLTYELLRVLVESSPNVVTHEEIIDQVWGGRAVSPETLIQRVLILRNALGDDAEHPRYVEVLRGQGYRLVPRAKVLPAEPQRSFLLHHRVLAGAGIVMSLAALAAVFWAYAPTANPFTPRVAVLPLENRSTDPDQAYFTAGVHDEIINHLTKIHGLRVISSDSVALYSDSTKSIREIASDLDVEALMTGSVRFDGESVRITARLIEGATGEFLWSEAFEHELSDIFRTQSNIALNIASVLAAELSPEELQAIDTSPTDSTEAYALYLRALGAEDPEAAMTMLDQAIDADPDFAVAYAAKAGIAAWMVTGFATEVSRADWEAVGIDSANRAIEIDPTLGFAYASMGAIHQVSGRLDLAEPAIEKAFRLSPYHHAVQFYYYRLKRAIGDYEEAARAAEYIVNANPNHRRAYHQLGVSHRYAGNYEAAAAAFRKAADLDPTIPEHHAGLAYTEISRGNYDKAAAGLFIAEDLWSEKMPLFRVPQLALAYSRAGLQQDAERLVAEFSERAEREPADDGLWAMAYLAMNDYDRALEWLERAVTSSTTGNGLAEIKANAYQDPVLDEGRFRRLRDRIGIL